MAVASNVVPVGQVKRLVQPPDQQPSGLALPDDHAEDDDAQDHHLEEREDGEIGHPAGHVACVVQAEAGKGAPRDARRRALSRPGIGRLKEPLPALDHG